MNASKKGEATKASRENEESKVVSKPKVKAGYCERGLDKCHFCGLNFNVGERIPRIIIGCGHTFCTSCLSYFLRNHRIRCPLCRKLLKGVDSVDKLPLNFNILYEVVTRDPLLSRVNFEKCLQADPDMYQDDEAYERDFAPYMCQKHEQRIKHFYCSEHPSIFCRECIKDLHNLEACFVVDLYEIEKMRKLQEQNNEMNRRQLSRRQDGASESYVEHAKLPPQEPNPLFAEKQAERRSRHEQATRAAVQQQYQHQPQRYPVQQPPMQGAGPAPNNNAAIVEFDAAQFDGQGISSQQLMKQQMLSGAGGSSGAPNQQFAQTHFGYGQGGMPAQKREQADEASFSDDEEDEEEGETAENGEEEEDNSDYEEGELNSAQKQKLKRDLLMMGYGGQNGQFEDEDEDEVVAQALIADAYGKHPDAHKMLQMQQQQDQQQQLLLQQAQFQEAMRIQMAMKQMPIDDGDMATAQAGLRVKQLGAVNLQYQGVPVVGVGPAGVNPLETIVPIDDNGAAFDLTPPVFTPQSDGGDDDDDDEQYSQNEEEQQQLTEKERFELEKRLLKEQMKEQLLGRSAKPAAPAQAAASANKHIIVSENNPVGAEAEEEEKHHAAVKEEISGAPQTSDKQLLENGGDAATAAEQQQRDVLVESLQTPSPAHAQEEQRVDTPRDTALEKQSLSAAGDNKSSQSNGAGAGGNVNQKENTAPDNQSAATAATAAQ